MRLIQIIYSSAYHYATNKELEKITREIISNVKIEATATICLPAIWDAGDYGKKGGHQLAQISLVHGDNLIISYRSNFVKEFPIFPQFFAVLVPIMDMYLDPSFKAEHKSDYLSHFAHLITDYATEFNCDVYGIFLPTNEGIFPIKPLDISLPIPIVDHTSIHEKIKFYMQSNKDNSLLVNLLEKDVHDIELSRNESGRAVNQPAFHLLRISIENLGLGLRNNLRYIHEVIPQLIKSGQQAIIWIHTRELEYSNPYIVLNEIIMLWSYYAEQELPYSDTSLPLVYKPMYLCIEVDGAIIDGIAAFMQSIPKTIFEENINSTWKTSVEVNSTSKADEVIAQIKSIVQRIIVDPLFGD